MNEKCKRNVEDLGTYNVGPLHCKGPTTKKPPYLYEGSYCFLQAPKILHTPQVPIIFESSIF